MDTKNKTQEREANSILLLSLIWKKFGDHLPTRQFSLNAVAPK